MTARLPQLDGLRGVAIGLVFGVHCFGVPHGGQIGVDIFFMLSGFLITSILLEEHVATGRISFASFYRRRAARLLPALFVFLAIYLLIATAKGVDGLEPAAIGTFYVSNLVEAFGGNAMMVRAGIPHLWSLAEEEQFYLLWPLLLPIFARRTHPVKLLLGVLALLIMYRFVLALGGAGHSRLYNGPDTHMDGLVLGATIAFLLQRRPRFRISPIWIAVGLPILVVALDVRDPSQGWDALGLPITEAAIATLLLGALTAPALARGLSLAPLRFLGRISYSLYLWHYTLVWAWGSPRHAWAAAAASLAVACISTVWIEEPLRRRMRTGNRVVPAPAIA